VIGALAEHLYAPDASPGMVLARLAEPADPQSCRSPITEGGYLIDDRGCFQSGRSHGGA